jgi:putative ABC transport system permease protein
MTWLTLSLREWERRPLRTFITVAGVGLAVGALFSLLAFEDGYRSGLKRELDHLGAHILVVPKGCPYDAASIALHGASWPCYLKAQYLDEVRAAPGVATAAPVLMAAWYDASGHQNVCVGIDTNMLALKPGWRISGQFPSARNDILIGSDLADRRGWRVGQDVRLPMHTNATFHVRGILAPTQSPDDTFAFLPLSAAQTLLHHPAELTHILVKLREPNDLEQVVGQLRGCEAGLYMNVVPLAHLFRTIQEIVSSTRLLLGCVVLIALIVAGAGVSNSLLMAVAERTREIGVLRALGASRGQVWKLFWAQTIQVCLAGALMGMALAFLSSTRIEAWIRSQLPFAPREGLIQWQGWIVAACFACAIVLGSVAGFLPAWRAANLSPMEALRKGGGA